MKRIYFLLPAIAFTVSCMGQMSKEEMTTYITNGASRNWQFKTYHKTLGPECSGDGQLFTFTSDGVLQRRRCINGKKDYQAVNWTLETAQNGDWEIKFKEPIEVEPSHYMKSMLVYLPQPGTKIKGKEMRLQQPPDCKACLEQVLVLTSID